MLGEKSDYELILSRLDKLCTWGDEPTTFCNLLKPVVHHFIKSFEFPTSGEVIDFWQRIFSRYDQGSGPTLYSGWITSFAFWDADGNCLQKKDHHPDNLVTRYGNRNEQGQIAWKEDVIERLVLDGVSYHRINGRDVPNGFCTVPVSVNDNGYEFDGNLHATPRGGKRMGLSEDQVRPPHLFKKRH